MDQPTPIPPKPQWLLRLEEESWQAELIISGVAIFGALQLPGGIDNLIDWTLTNISPRYSTFLYFFFIYLSMGAYALIVTFIGHFVLRTFWVGLLGLNSVFPQGINRESDTYSPALVDNLIRDLPDTTTRIQQIDRLCSLIFAFGTLLTMVFLAINVDILVLAGLYRLALELLGEQVAGTVGIIFLGMLLFLFLLVALLNAKPLRSKPLVIRWHYQVYSFVNRLFMHFFARPIIQLSMIFQTNVKIRNYLGVVALFFLALMAMSFVRMSSNRLLGLANPERYFQKYDRSDRLITEQYASLRNDNQRLLSILLDSDVIEGPYLRVFVPVFSYESATFDTLCGTWTDRPDLDKDANTAARRQFALDCYALSHRFFIDDRPLSGIDPIRHDHPNHGEAGFLVYLSVDSLPPGRHILVVEKLGSTARRMQAVFWKEGRE